MTHDYTESEIRELELKCPKCDRIPTWDDDEDECPGCGYAGVPLCIACGTAEATLTARDGSPYCAGCWGEMLALGAACPSCREDHPSSMLERTDGLRYCNKCGTTLRQAGEQE